MPYDKGGSYLREVDHVSILESIDEVFDGASSLMTQNSVMYGSSVTSVIAGLPIVGDLDIAVSNQEYMRLCQNFASSVKWVQVDGKNIPERNPDQGGYRFKVPGSDSSYPGSAPALVASFSSGSGKYPGAKHLPISNVVAFETVNNARVQLMQSKAMTGDILEDALHVVRKVDFTFCGMALDRYGRMLETIPHAHSDCVNRIIRIQDYQPRLTAKRLKQRLFKYIHRGWNLSASIDQILLNLKRAQIEYAKRPKNKSKKIIRKRNVPGIDIKITVAQGVMIVVSTELMAMMGSKGLARDIVNHIAGRDFGFKLHIKTNKDGTLSLYHPKKAKMNKAAANAIASASFDRICQDRNIDIARLQHEIARKKATTKLSTSPYKVGYTNGAYGYNATSTSTSTSTYGKLNTD